MKKTIMLIVTIMCTGTIMAQSSYFNSLNDHKKTIRKDTLEIPIDIKRQGTMTIDSFLKTLSVQELEFITQQYINRHSFLSDKKPPPKSSQSNVLSMYNGDSRELSICNLLEVMEEVGISNRLFVLAQSLLETGYYSSNACLSKHNLFGLTNPRTGKLFSFDCWESSVVAYKRFIQYKYKGGSYLAFLKRIGYAEDPRYISKVIHISRKLNKEINIVD